MSLLRLLAAGKSLVDMKDAETRYRVTGQRLLPQFGAGRNPFSDKEKAEPVQTEPHPPGDHKPNGVGKETSSTPALSREREAAPRSRLDGRTTSANSNSQKLRGVLRRRTAALLGELKARLVELLAKRRCKAAKATIPRFTKPPVQGELTLERIKVVRNDLSDVDLEVVPAKPPTAPAMRAVEKTAGAENAWGRVTARVLGSSKT
ncbi:MAG: hypothetical protein ACLQU3_11950 [Limisphaerales bacterium]